MMDTLSKPAMRKNVGIASTMHRTPLLDLLYSYLAEQGLETIMHEDSIRFVNQYEKCFERSLAIGHITGSAWILDYSHKFVLLTHHRKLNKWFQPGGHCDGIADVRAVAIQEATEETGLQVTCLQAGIFDIDIHTIPANRKESEHLHYDIRFVVEADMKQPFSVSNESKNLAWMPLKQVIRYNNSESLLRMVRKTFLYL